jgi:flagellar biosynthesis/type III secretory pathway protein FliH
MADLYDFPTLEPTGELVHAHGISPVERAAEVLAQAHANAAAVEAEATERGQAAGYAAGLAEATIELEPARAALTAAVQGVAERRDELLRSLEHRAVELALALADKIVGAALGADPSLVREVVAGALRRSADRDRLIVELHPDDLELVREADDLARSLGIQQLDLIGERRVGRGGCVVRTSTGEIDGRIEEQLARAEEILREAFGA